MKFARGSSRFLGNSSAPSTTSVLQQSAFLRVQAAGPRRYGHAQSAAFRSALESSQRILRLAKVLSIELCQT